MTDMADHSIGGKSTARAELPAGFVPPWELAAMEKGERVLLAFSGGADSSALLDMLMHAGAAVECAHLDHMIRGAEAERDAEFCARAAERYGVPIHIGHADVPASAKAHGEGLEEAARRERYAFFERVMSERGIRLLVTAHNADDNLETMLLRLARGCGARGMCGIPTVRRLGGGREVVRPMLGMTKAQVLEYCREREIPFVYDSTNGDVEYSRNRLRALVLPELRRINPAVEEAAARLAANIGADCAYLDSLADGFAAAHCADGTAPARELYDLPAPVARRVIRRLCDENGVTMAEEKHISALLAALGEDAAKSFSLPGGVRASVSDGVLRFSHGAAEAAVLPDAEYPLKCGSNPLPGGFSVDIYDAEHGKSENINIIYKVSTKTYLYTDKIKGALFARPRRPGDRIVMGGMHKSLKKLLCDKKVPLGIRGILPVICDGDGILYVPFVGARDGAAPAASAAHEGTLAVTVRLAADGTV